MNKLLHCGALKRITAKTIVNVSVVGILGLHVGIFDFRAQKLDSWYGNGFFKQEIWLDIAESDGVMWKRDF